ncbi:hypothetical protein ARMGADRAFT_1158655 [Armillaria gallica]|uniref:J domain-containing protein n=1 Tax=Armillaria gallica TaxID=47427 RepID=A0A2H3E7D1_ARMGA|nr:hypothetical protein ARMGADRAFT_1158655 [Armillaria gallica]
MATYNYDESGQMAAYFVITFLALILIPLSLSTLPSRKNKPVNGCQCDSCVQQRARLSKVEGHKPTTKAIFIAVGWSIVFFLAHRVANTKLDNKVYDPYEILGIKLGTPEKEIKSHFKKLSRLYHPDKVRATVNQTLEEIQNRFVDITKAYKSLTDETIRRNWEEWGDPDGRQQMSMGIALPTWIIEGKNNIWVLGFYGLIFGGGLPVLVGRWWFGSRQKTKDGIAARSAAAFFKSVTDSSGMDETLGMVVRAYQWECQPVVKDQDEFKRLEGEISKQSGRQWTSLVNTLKDENAKRALVLVYAHLLRLKVASSALQKEQRRVLLHTPTLLNSLLIMATSRNWLVPTLAVMRLHGYLTQALLPWHSRVAQLPGVKPNEGLGESLDQFVKTLEEKADARIPDIKKATEKWGKLDVVDASFKVIDEKTVTPSSIVFLVVKLRLGAVEGVELDIDTKENEAKDYEFLNIRKDAEDVAVTPGWAHAPYWPANRKPSWWIVLADPKSLRLAIPPMKITDIPYARDLPASRPFRSYKVQFQAPPNTSVNPWRVYIVSDTFVGPESEGSVPVTLEVVERKADEVDGEDEISEPEEDSLAGQMAMMKGQRVKKIQEEESDDESGTDDDDDGNDSSSDSD